MKRVLITGIAGFIGNKLESYYLNKGFLVYGVDVFDNTNNPNHFVADLTNLEQTKTVVEKVTPDIVIHCAGNASVPISVTDPLLDLQRNVLVTETLLVALSQTKTHCRFVFLSSAAVYGSSDGTPLKEEAPKNPLSPYAFHKSICEDICLFFSKGNGIDVKIARIFSAYGPGLKKQIFWDMHNKINDTGLLDMGGTGSESRDFIFIDDLIEAIYILSTIETEEMIFNVASGLDYTIREIAHIYAQLSNKPSSIVSFTHNQRRGDPSRMVADISKLKQTGFKTKTRIEDGIKQYIDWCKLTK